MASAVDGAAVVCRLRELDRRTGGTRVAWTDPWREERARFDALVHELVPEVRSVTDAFANRWYLLDGSARADETVLVGSHTDCVAGGGWLDGVLGVHAGLALLAAIASDTHRPPRSVALVDWADEEGVRFGRSLNGSSAACGALQPSEFDRLRDEQGMPAAEIVASDGFQAAQLGHRVPELEPVTCALELHIEQGPILEATGRRVAAVSGCLGVSRWRCLIEGHSGHAGATPMHLRADPVAAAAEAIRSVLAEAERADGLATVGSISATPGIPTAVAGQCVFTLDLRHAEAGPLTALAAVARRLVDDVARRRGCRSGFESLLAIEPVAFTPALVDAAARFSDGGPPLRSGALHDAAALARGGIPSVMMFAPSRGGISHTRAEDTDEHVLIEAIERFAALVGDILWA